MAHMTDVVVVESPAKAKTINKYLGGGYTVLASFGHVRDLPPKDGSVRPDEDFAMDWEADERGDKQVGAIAKALKGAKHPLSRHRPGSRGRGDFLACARHAGGQERAEGRQRPAHHLQRDHPQRRRATPWPHPRELDQPLIEAYLARRALDYLVGFTLSPVLWRKLPGSRSAGRVQSVALRLICEREAEIEVFRAARILDHRGRHSSRPRGAPFTARLTHYEGKKLDQFDLNDEAEAMRRQSRGRGRQLHRRLGREASASSATRRRRSPPPPCSRRPSASSASARSRPCAWRSSSMRASISAARRSA